LIIWGEKITWKKPKVFFFLTKKKSFSFKTSKNKLIKLKKKKKKKLILVGNPRETNFLLSCFLK